MLHGEAKEYIYPSNNGLNIRVSQGIYLNGTITKGLVIYQDAVRFADPQEEDERFEPDGKSGRYKMWNMTSVTFAEFDRDGRATSREFMSKEDNYEMFANR